MIKNAVRVLLATCLVAAVTAIGAQPVEAGTPLQCQISMDIRAGFVPLTGMEEFTVVLGGGSCYSDMEGTYIATILSGAGTSRGFGPGTNCPTSTTENFKLTLTVQLLSTSTGQLRTVTQTLTAPPGVNTLPGSQPVTATAPLKDPGAGVLSYRIFHQCPPDGENSALYVGTIAN